MHCACVFLYLIFDSNLFEVMKPLSFQNWHLNGHNIFFLCLK